MDHKEIERYVKEHHTWGRGGGCSGFSEDIDNPMPSILNTKYTRYNNGHFHYECTKGYEPGGNNAVSIKIDNFTIKYMNEVIMYFHLSNGQYEMKHTRVVDKYQDQNNGKWFLELEPM